MGNGNELIDPTAPPDGGASGTAAGAGAEELRVQVELSAQSARLVAGLLELLAELPSTADMVAETARAHACHIAEELPPARRRTERDHEASATGSVSLELETATEVVELLQLFAEMPSTPPMVADDARRQADDIARYLPDAGAQDPSADAGA